MTHENAAATAIIEPELPSVRAMVRAAPVSGEGYELGATTLRVGAGSHEASAEEREAILTSLYNEREGLTRAKRLGEMSPGDAEYLVELNQYIDEWEAAETKTSASDDVWTKLDTLAQSMLAVQAKVERHQK